MRVVESYMQARIPLETFVTDSQYMDKDQDFTFSADYAVEDFQVCPSFCACLLGELVASINTLLASLLAWCFGLASPSSH